MPIIIGSDATSQISQRSVNEANKGLRASLTRLASGHRINSAMDDAAGLAISENIQAQLRSLNQARRNTFDGISLLESADAGLQESSEILGRMRELAMQAGNDSLNDSQQSAIQTEYQQLAAEMDRQSATTEYNGQKLLDGSLSQANGGLEFQVGIRDSLADSIQVTIEEVSTHSLQIDSTSVDTPDAARAALEDLDVALNEVTRERANLGAFSNRLTTAANNLSIASENAAAANSRIQDADIAMESTRLASQQMLQQAAVAVMSQANAQPAVVLNLLGQ